MKSKRKSKVKDNTRIVIVTMTVLFFITITGFYLFNWYINIDISTPKIEETYTAQKTAQTVAEVKEEDKTITQMIEEVSDCVVGISKLKNNGSSIFLNDGTTRFGVRYWNNCDRRRLYSNK
jgi:hypothetical protein